MVGIAENHSFFEYPDPFVWWHVTLYLVAVTWGATIIGIFGIGGGAIFVPALLLLPGVTPTVAVGTVLLGCAPMSAARMCQMYYFGYLDCCKAVPLIVGAVFGSIVAQIALPYVPGDLGSVAIGLLATMAGVNIHYRVIAEAAKQEEESEAQNQKEKEKEEEEETKCSQNTEEKREEGNEGSHTGVKTEDGVMKLPIDSLDGPETPGRSEARICGMFGICGETRVPVEVELDGGNKDLTVVVPSEKGGEEECAEERDEDDTYIAGSATMFILGLVASFLSSITGTGGLDICLRFIFSQSPFTLRFLPSSLPL